MRACVLFAVVTVVAIAASAGNIQPARASTATIESTCRAALAHIADRLVSPFFCKERLAAHPGADARGLARIAAAIGASNSDAARREAEREMRQTNRDGVRFRRGLGQCARLFGSARDAFVAADEALGERRYAAARDKLVGVPMKGHDCMFGVASRPLLNYTVENQQIALLCIAITSLINIRS